MRRALVIFAWIAVLLLAGSLRFPSLGDRPMHFDEATGARLLAMRMQQDGGEFDPTHYHGPLQAQAASVIARLRGEQQWDQLSKTTLRLLPALAGWLLVALPWFVRKRWGDPIALSMATLLATSPLCAYYSRMFIHEMLLTFFGAAVLLLLTGKPRPILLGLLLGLMFATKETVAISVAAWLVAALIAGLSQAPKERWALGQAWLRTQRWNLLIAGMTAMATSIAFYSNFGRHPSGVVDAVTTFFVYEPVLGHEKAFSYYLHLLIIPHRAGGVWWFGTPVVLLAIGVWWQSLRERPSSKRLAIQFLFYAALGHLALYSFIPYKTPWLMCLPWVHVCVLAGFAVALVPRRLTAIAWPLLGFAVLTQWQQSRLALGRYASDERNPFAYVPTSRNVEQLGPWLEELSEQIPAASEQPILVLGGAMWPLPWVLRKFEVSYASQAPEELASVPILITSYDQGEALFSQLPASHVILQRSLRAGVPFYVFINKDLWERWNRPE